MEVTIHAHIRKNTTGEVRIYPSTLERDEDGYIDPYIWEEGNYACDCNRCLFFARTEDEWGSSCGEGEYSVNIYHGDEIIYKEFEHG